MKFEISYVEDYGWHCGRPLFWISLFLFGLVSLGCAYMFERLAGGVSDLQFAFTLLAPGLLLAVLAFRLKRKLNGEPFCFAPLVVDSDNWVQLVHREESPRKFWLLFGFELVMWLSVVSVQFTILSGMGYFQG